MQFDIIRAWKDEEYRQSLGQDVLLESPVGEVELSEAELAQINGTGDDLGGKVNAKGYGSVGGVAGNSYNCGNFSIRPTTNVNLGEKAGANRGGINLLGALVSEISSALSTRNRSTTTVFDFSCSVSGGLGGGPCIFAGEKPGVY